MTKAWGRAGRDEDGTLDLCNNDRLDAKSVSLMGNVLWIIATNPPLEATAVNYARRAV